MMPTEQTKPGPSAEWTAEERLVVIASIVESMHSDKRILPYLLDYMDRILFTARLSASFLEANRDHILSGQ